MVVEPPLDRDPMHQLVPVNQLRMIGVLQAIHPQPQLQQPHEVALPLLALLAMNGEQKLTLGVLELLANRLLQEQLRAQLLRLEVMIGEQQLMIGPVELPKLDPHRVPANQMTGAAALLPVALVRVLPALEVEEEVVRAIK